MRKGEAKRDGIVYRERERERKRSVAAGIFVGRVPIREATEVVQGREVVQKLPRVILK